MFSCLFVFFSFFFFFFFLFSVFVVVDFFIAASDCVNILTVLSYFDKMLILSFSFYWYFYAFALKIKTVPIKALLGRHD